jgi:hypothetical protein
MGGFRSSLLQLALATLAFLNEPIPEGGDIRAVGGFLGADTIVCELAGPDAGRHRGFKGP